MKESKYFSLKDFVNNDDEVYHVARTTISSKNDLVFHRHDYAEVFWIKEGHGIHIVNGLEVPLEPGTLVLIRPDDIHSFKVSLQSKGLVITNIAFFRNSLDHFRQRYFPNSKKFFWINDSLPYSFLLSKDILNELSAMTDRLISQPKDLFHLDHVMLHVFSFLTIMDDNKLQKPHWLAHAFANYNTSQHLKNGIEGSTTLCDRSADHVNRTLKKYLKQSLSETVNKARLDYATCQLTMTNAPVKSICSDCGYENISYFYRLFKKYYGITPAEYRSSNRKVF